MEHVISENIFLCRIMVHRKMEWGVQRSVQEDGVGGFYDYMVVAFYIDGKNSHMIYFALVCLVSLDPNPEACGSINSR